MISVIVIWMYALITVFLLGYGFATISEKIFSYRIRSFTAILMAGVAAATVYAQLFSLFAGVGLWANVLLIAICALLAYGMRSALFAYVKECITYISLHRKRMWAIGFLFLLMAYGTSRGIIHYDTGLYHAQSIRWIEEYGLVKGLGNLHCRLAYNSASFPLTALYSMRFLGGQSYHVIAGFLAFILAVECLSIREAFRRKKMLPSDYARCMAIYYLLMIFDEMVSPASDYFMVLTAFYLVIRWLMLLEKSEKEPEGYGLLCLLGVYLMTIKLSAALILLLVVYPAVLLIRQKKWQRTGAFLSLGIVTAVPYLLRNVLISGWLVYPFTFLDLFSVDYKIPKGLAQYDAKEIQVWGRGYTDVLQYDMPMKDWIVNWFMGQSGMDKLFILAALSTALVLIVRLVRLALRKEEKIEFLLVDGTLLACFLFWLCTSPLIRYGCVYVYLTAAVIWGRALEEITSLEFIKKLCYLLLILFGYYKLVMFGVENVQTSVNAYWIAQKDYENYPVKAYEVNGVTFYYAEDGDRTGYDAFPASPTKADITFLGDEIKDGFKEISE